MNKCPKLGSRQGALKVYNWVFAFAILLGS